MRLLAAADHGRVVFTVDALPAIRPVNHLVDHGLILIRTRLTTSIARAAARWDDVVVAYEADEFHSERRIGWSVVVTGYLRAVTDPGEVARCEQLLRPWVNRTDAVVAIEPVLVTGFEITDVA
jgi:hypothetical protein